MTEKILIIEDDADIRFILDMALSEAGYQVEHASGSSLLEKRNDWPDLLILDKGLPNIDGFAICKHLRKNKETKDIPIVMISCYHNLKEKATEAGVNDFIEKPFDLKTILLVVEKQIRLSQQELHTTWPISNYARSLFKTSLKSSRKIQVLHIHQCVWTCLRNVQCTRHWKIYRSLFTVRPVSFEPGARLLGFSAGVDCG